MSSQQRDCPGFPPDSLFIRRSASEPGRNKTATKIGIIFGLSYISDDFRHFVPLRNLYYFQLAVIVPQITNLRQRERVRVPVPVLTPPGVPASPWCSGRFAICRIGTESVNVKIRLDILMKTWGRFDADVSMFWCRHEDVFFKLKINSLWAAFWQERKIMDFQGR